MLILATHPAKAVTRSVENITTPFLSSVIVCAYNAYYCIFIPFSYDALVISLPACVCYYDNFRKPWRRKFVFGLRVHPRGYESSSYYKVIESKSQ